MGGSPECCKHSPGPWRLERRADTIAASGAGKDLIGSASGRALFERIAIT